MAAFPVQIACSQAGRQTIGEPGAWRAPRTACSTSGGVARQRARSTRLHLGQIGRVGDCSVPSSRCPQGVHRDDANAPQARSPRAQLSARVTEVAGGFIAPVIRRERVVTSAKTGPLSPPPSAQGGPVDSSWFMVCSIAPFYPECYSIRLRDSSPESPLR